MESDVLLPRGERHPGPNGDLRRLSDRACDGPLGADPEGRDMITSGTHYNSGCCLDYGNSETCRACAGAMAPTRTAAFITAVLKNNGTTDYALRAGDATKGALSTYDKGTPPTGWKRMKTEGAFVLRSGVDCCNTILPMASATGLGTGHVPWRRGDRSATASTESIKLGGSKAGRRQPRPATPANTRLASRGAAQAPGVR